MGELNKTIKEHLEFRELFKALCKTPKDDLDTIKSIKKQMSDSSKTPVLVLDENKLS